MVFQPLHNAYQFRPAQRHVRVEFDDQSVGVGFPSPHFSIQPDQLCVIDGGKVYRHHDAGTAAKRPFLFDGFKGTEQAHPVNHWQRACGACQSQVFAPGHARQRRPIITQPGIQ